ncbi:hypothetical protein AVEN_247881-1 [Araneus ventricosus]|uniref:Uncharacterized protein n=1 Tax=Araneus ventricosus TaxID=182803 RepID=A0A4Y2MYN6_ARAVE|nr:hypothetical protein AVEN_247881-1 [Araneus ventricosus]
MEKLYLPPHGKVQMKMQMSRKKVRVAATTDKQERSPTGGTWSFRQVATTCSKRERRNNYPLKFSPDLYLYTCWIALCMNGVQKFLPTAGGAESPTGVSCPLGPLTGATPANERGI